MRTAIITMLILANVALAGPNNPGAAAADVTPIWTNQALTTTMITSSASHKVGLDKYILCDVFLQNIDAGGGITVDVTPIWKMPGGDAAGYPTYEIGNPQTLTWSSLKEPGFKWRITAMTNADLLYFQVSTTDPNTAHLTLRTVGSP